MEAVAVVARSRAELLDALQTIAKFVEATSDAYEQANSALAPGIRVGTKLRPRHTVLELLDPGAHWTAKHVSDRWRLSRSGIPIGIDSDGETVRLPFERGTRIVVGGTTGAGKTELLRNYVTSLALTASPERVGFALVDFKGGGAFGELAALPHTIALVAALDEGYTERWMAHLQATLDLRRHSDRRPEHLFVVVDEFSTLMTEAPRVGERLLTELASTGRSLHVHLVIGMQAPQSLPTRVLANADVRIGLRMISRDDSLALLGIGGAEQLPRSGEGLLITDDDSVRRFELPAPLPREQTISLVEACVRASQGRKGIGRPWPSPLPSSVRPDQLRVSDRRAIPFGIVDRPKRLSQETALWRPSVDGHFLVYGPPGSGKSAALAAVAEMAVHSPFAVHAQPPSSKSRVIRGRDIRTIGDVDRLVRSIRSISPHGYERTDLFVLDGLDEIHVDVPPQEVLNRLMVVMRRSEGTVRLALSSRRVRFGAFDIRQYFGLVVRLAPWSRAVEDEAIPQDLIVTSRVPGRGVWGSDEVQMAALVDSQA